ncbi:hypothetical protein QBC40DRAFT_323521 [Triangularia verruculosa]|uniref:Cyanovirin-N domain-containing protein n=1 Tax=Triangularia verruculosa TaxID=2587418 RepID=A0AAN6XNF2_9PEZI|nr:hypothetical protein QBC40DRAFT_323521 [Triangularia verruculosa]
MFAPANLSAIWLLSLVVVPLATAQGTVFNKFHDFSKSCTNITLTSIGYLQADCQPLDLSKPPQTVGVDLNLCVGFDSAIKALDWSIYGKLSNDCKDCVLNTDSGAIMECVCEDESTHEIKNSTLDLDTGVGNYNGEVVCYATAPTTMSQLTTAFSTSIATTTTSGNITTTTGY